MQVTEEYRRHHVRPQLWPQVQQLLRNCAAWETCLNDHRNLLRSPLHHFQRCEQHDGGDRREQQLVNEQLADHCCPAGRPFWQNACLQELCTSHAGLGAWVYAHHEIRGGVAFCVALHAHLKSTDNSMNSRYCRLDGFRVLF